jgi:rfaE bifunctional protein nucleotidyltransferase chain/domain
MIIGIESVDELKRECHDNGGRFIMTNGCFDLFHAGHLYSLNYARRITSTVDFAFRSHSAPPSVYEDRLLVAINSSESIQKIKGPDRPIIPLADRLYVLNNLKCVDYIVVFNDESVYSTILKIKPDILVKGGTTEDIVGKHFVNSYGGFVFNSPVKRGLSTSKIIENIRK